MIHNYDDPIWDPEDDPGDEPEIPGPNPFPEWDDPETYDDRSKA